MITPQTIQLGTNTFTVTALPAMESFILQPRLVPALADALGVAARVIEGGGLDALLNMDVMAALPDAIGKFFSKMPPAELEFITRKLLSTATVDNMMLFDGGRFDEVMRGRVLDVWRLLWFAVRVNYPDFFGLAGKLAGAAAAKKQPPSGASSTSAPPSPAIASSPAAG